MDYSSLRTHLAKLHQESFGWALGCCFQDPVEAEDVLQNTYIKILEGRARYDGRSMFKTWLFSVIRNTAADARRRNRWRSLRLFGREDGHELRHQTEPLDDEISRHQLQGRFRKMLTKLPHRQREILLLVFYHDLSLREAADVLDVSIGTARTHYERGKKRLRRWMEVTDDAPRLGREKNQEALCRTEAGG